MTRKELKVAAKAKLKGRVFVMLVPILIMGVISAVIASIASFTYGGGIIIEAPLAVGFALFYLKATRDEKTGLEDLFSQFKDLSRVWEQIKAYLLRWLYIVLGLICLIIPGIIMSLRYSQLEYIMADNPDLSCKEAMQECKALMKGRIDEYFALLVSFIGWFLLSILTLGILFIYVAPYFELSLTQYYLKIRAEDDSELTAQDAGGKAENDGLFDGDSSIDSASENTENKDGDIF
jgi:uncharacterized membrane protein